MAGLPARQLERLPKPKIDSLADLLAVDRMSDGSTKGGIRKRLLLGVEK